MMANNPEREMKGTNGLTTSGDSVWPRKTLVAALTDSARPVPRRKCRPVPIQPTTFCSAPQ